MIDSNQLFASSNNSEIDWPTVGITFGIVLCTVILVHLVPVAYSSIQNCISARNNSSNISEEPSGESQSSINNNV